MIDALQNGNPIRFSTSDLLKKYDLDLLWIKDLTTIKYLTGFTGSTANLLLDGDGVKYLHVDGRYTTQSQLECPDSKVIEIKKPLDDLCQSVRDLGPARLGFEAMSASYADYRTLKKELDRVQLVAIDENLAGLRIIKSPEELDKIRHAIDISTKAFNDLAGEIHLGWTESEAAWFLDRRFRELGGQGNSFDSLVCSGPRSAIVHGKPTDREFAAGDFVIIDRGVIANHYVSDETNTFVLGSPDPKQKEIYQIVKEAHDRCIESVRPGMKCSEIDAVARECINQKGFGDYFGHGTGHGLGMEVHELPIISPRGSGYVEEGMVFSIEPGIYIPEWGGVRIEDLVVATADGCEILTKCDKQTFELKID